MFKMRCLLVSCFVLCVSTLWAQNDLQVQGSSPDIYLVHTIAAKETWFSVGRLYNLTPKEIAAYNKSNLTEVLKIGQVLNIPLTVDNFSQDGQRAGDEVFVPLYHTVQPKEWLYRISQNHNKVPVETLETWNNTKNDQLRAGMNLIVGYLKVRTGQSAYASRGSKRIVTQASPPVAKNANKATEPVVNKPVETVVNKPDETVVNKPTETIVNKPAENKPVTAASTETKPVTPPATQPQNKPVTTTPAPVETSTTTTTQETWDGYKGGYFKHSYSEKGNNATGNAGIFRSTSGWKDGKYYALINEVPVGTIIKVTFPSTNKSVYAKVLGQLPEMRESVGLKLRLSDAAAAELGADIGKFYVDVKY